MVVLMLTNFPLVITLNQIKASCGKQDFIWCYYGRLLSHEGKFEGRFPLPPLPATESHKDYQRKRRWQCQFISLTAPEFIAKSARRAAHLPGENIGEILARRKPAVQSDVRDRPRLLLEQPLTRAPHPRLHQITRRRAVRRLPEVLHKLCHP